jgi:hypothetical protein
MQWLWPRISSTKRCSSIIVLPSVPTFLTLPAAPTVDPDIYCCCRRIMDFNITEFRASVSENFKDKNGKIKQTLYIIPFDKLKNRCYNVYSMLFNSEPCCHKVVNANGTINHTLLEFIIYVITNETNHHEEDVTSYEYITHTERDTEEMKDMLSEICFADHNMLDITYDAKSDSTLFKFDSDDIEFEWTDISTPAVKNSYILSHSFIVRNH